ncbi:MAG: hypothetical protein H6978_10780 [Gammaproteobacteria bacterium]|nr:hypothetical protein [Gammaproteobacteria bacterium]
MELISFDALRTLNFPRHVVLKPEYYLRHPVELRAADWILYPEYWQLNALVFGLHARIFPSLATYLIGHDKVAMTRVFETVAPAHVPLTLIHGNTQIYADEIWAKLPTPFVAKIPKASMGEGVFLIETRSDWRRYCERTDVLYAQEYLPIDRDLRLIVIGEKVVGGYWRLQSANGFHNNIARGGVAVPGPIPPAATALVEGVAGTLGIDHAGFDVALVDGHPYLLEFNRLFGNQGLNELVGDITPGILNYLETKLQDSDPRRPKRGGGTRRGGRRGRLSRAA